jgi:hypothetical protein
MSDLMDVEQAEHGDEDEEDEGEDDEDEEREMEMSPKEMEMMLQECMERIEQLEDNMMGSYMEEMEEVDSRLSAVEETTTKLSEEPKKPRSMSDNSESIFSDGRRMSSTDSAGTTSR